LAADLYLPEPNKEKNGALRVLQRDRGRRMTTEQR